LTKFVGGSGTVAAILLTEFESGPLPIMLVAST